MNRGVWYRRYTVDLREGEAGKRHWERFRSQAPRKKTPAGFGFQEEPQTHPFYCSYRDPTDVWRTWGEGSVPKTIFHFSKAISGSSPPPNSAFQENPTPSQLLPVVLPHHHLEFGSRGGKQTRNRLEANLSTQELVMREAWVSNSLHLKAKSR